MISFPDYQILVQIYESANSLVYRGIREQDNKAVILKVLKEDYPTPNELTLYRQEYEITHNLNLEGVVKAYGLEPYQRTLVIILEDFGASSLKQLMNEPVGKRPVVPLPKFLNIAIKIVEILGNIHSSNIIHKDINPSNIVFNPETGQIKIIDFGISTQLNRENTTLKNPNVLEGTLAYMSPEQTGRMNRSLDYRTDFYSLGVTFYELLVGQLPFETSDELELVHCHIAKQPVPPHLLRAEDREIPQAVSDIVMKLMAKTAEERYQSAWGIKADLEKCLTHLQTTGKIEPFPLGTQDISEKFQIPQKLYGRKQEIDRLITAFERVISDKSELMLVSGYSGIGKSALVQELYKPITEKRGYFISGKFDQYQRNIPYSAIVSAFQELVKQLLTESEGQLNTWRERILAALGINSQVIIDVIPEVELILGKQPAVPELGSMEAQNRFNLVFQNFIQVFTNSGHPLAIFLDDLQWADGASLKLMQRLMNASHPGLFLIGAYRDNEVSAAHPLMLTIEEIAKTGAIVEGIFLAPLDLPTIIELIIDTLNCSEERAKPLAKLVLFKTGGNPFFMNEFLKSLYTEKLLEFNSPQSLMSIPPVGKGGSQGGWQWDLEQIQARGFTDNVVELMTFKIQKLPENTQQMLKLAACMGNQFDLKMLATTYQKSLRETVNDLYAAVAESLVMPLGNRGDLELALIQEESPNIQLPTTPFQLPDYKFIHDRIQQAAYSLISEQDKPIIHWEIGQLLLQNTLSDQRDEKIFDIVNQLNFGIDFISNQHQKDEVAQLNLIAGKKAKASAAYEPAFNYLQIGMRLLGEKGWQTQYDLALALYVEASEAAYLSGDFEQMERFVQIVRNQAKTVLDKAQVIEVKILALIAQTKLEQAVATGVELLRQLGVRLPQKPNKLNVLMGLLETKSVLAGKRISDLANLRQMSDPYKLAALRILSKIVSPAFIAAPTLLPLIAFKQVILSVKHGNCAESIYAYAIYGLILCGVVGDIESAYEFGQLALRLVERLNAKEFKTKALFVSVGFIGSWKIPIKETLLPLLEAYKSGLETGDLEYAAYAVLVYSFNAYLSGKNLLEIESQMAAYSEVMVQLKQEQSLNMHQPFHQAVLNLLDRAENPYCLIGDACDEETFLPLLIQANSRTSLCYVYLNKLILCYLFEQYSEALLNAAQNEQYLDGATGTFTVSCCYFYDSLTRLALYTNAPKTEQKHHKRKVIANQKKMKKWAHHAPMNQLHRYNLVEAERCRVIGKDALAMDYYDKAIALAKKSEYIHEAALAYELAAKFYLCKGKELSARAYMQEARYCYQLWGATAKVKDLEGRYPQLLAATVLGIKDAKTTTRLTTTGSGSSLDIATVMKASQAISGEIVLDKLLSSLMKILIENAGAQKGYLILECQGKLLIEAEGAIDSDRITVLQSIPVEKSHSVSLLLINYVARTYESVVLNDATNEGNFTNDPYIKEHQPKSILCVPLINQGKLTSIVYLENNLTTEAFTSDRLEILKLLSSQAAISIENAKLYREVLDREKELRQSERRLTQLLEAMPVGVFVADAKGKAYYVNSQAERLLGKGVIDNTNPEQLPEAYQLYLAGSGQIYPTQRDPVFCALEGASTNIDDMEIRQSDKIIPIEVWGTPIYDEDRNVAYAIAAFTDITERKQAEKLIAQYNHTLEIQVAERTQELKNTLNHLQATQEELIQSEKMAALGQLIAGVAHEINTPLGVIHASVENIADFFTEQLEQLPKFLQQLSPERQQDFFTLLHNATLQENSLSTREKRQLKRGLTRQLEEQAIKNADGIASILVALGIYEEIEPLLPLLKDSESQILLDTAYQLASVQKSTKNLSTATDRAAKVVFALKSYARYDATGEKVKANITDGIETVLTLYQNQLKQGLDVIKNYQSSPSILCYPDELHQVWTNLIHNALQAMDNRGTLRIDVSQPKESVLVSITDSGQGIPSEIKQKIFEPFFTTKRLGEGSGLGLYIIKKIIDKHQGTIEVESMPGKTTFTLSLPINVAEERPNV
ncbi:AAA family ATPase [Microcoleus sp. FACHB-SPT15]|uniref:ATP-binding sensor histidine kinase n=1 Tax=Microcoleus sp. FACHB-SPT15 TaxID=2692830 RepID=UPI00177B673D|nr:trifunctional serine/threonine-protein kinase/ATP-binding protein/sensor histidine kinase [Microcoleus sp. FACHB-SPT15]MBD1808828.1 AAA family ATPase [Microcoleus sp. FACHB-SPT15]